MAMQGVPVRWAHSGAGAQPGHGTGSPTCHRVCVPRLNATVLTVGAHAAIQAVLFNACGIKYRALLACRAQGGIASGQQQYCGQKWQQDGRQRGAAAEKTTSTNQAAGPLLKEPREAAEGHQACCPNNHRAHASQVRGVPPLKSASPWRCQDPALAAPPQRAPPSLAARSSERPCPQQCPPTPAAAPPPAAQGCTRNNSCSELGQAAACQAELTTLDEGGRLRAAPRTRITPGKGRNSPPLPPPRAPAGPPRCRAAGCAAPARKSPSPAQPTCRSRHPLQNYFF